MKSQLTLQQLATEIRDRAVPERKRDFRVNTPAIDIDATATELSFGDEKFSITDIAHEQIGTHADIPRAYYKRMQAEAPELLGENIRTWFRKYPVKRMVRTLDGRARAFLSDKYALGMDDENFVNTVMPVIADVEGAEVISTAITEERTFLKFKSALLEREVKVGDVVQFGMAFSNSEVGRGRLQGSLLAYQLVCKNGMVMPDESWGAAHVGGRQGARDLSEIFQLDTVQADAKATILKLRDFARELLTERRLDTIVDKMRGLTQITLKQPALAVELVAKQNGLVESEQNSILSHLIAGGDLSMWGLQNAVTRAAQDDDISYTRATELEQIGGKMLNLGNYRELIKEAA